MKSGASAMRYFFDIYDGDHWTRDDLGTDCRNDIAARRQAVLALVEMAREYIPSDGPTMDLTVRVRNATQTAFTLRLDFSTEMGAGLGDQSLLEKAL
jgi:hypothetical protein